MEHAGCSSAVPDIPRRKKECSGFIARQSLVCEGYAGLGPIAIVADKAYWPSGGPVVSMTSNSPTCEERRVIKSDVAEQRPVKVMHVVNGLALGGMENGLLKLTTGLTDGFDHRICCIRDVDPDFVQGRLRREQVVPLRLPRSRFSSSIAPLVSTMRKYRPDIVHSRNWGGMEAVIAARIAGVPVAIHSEHGYELDTLRSTPFRQRLMRRLAISLADMFFAVSRDLGDFHAQQMGVSPQRIKVLYNGVDTRRFAPDHNARKRVREGLGWSDEDFVVGATGRMVAIKDYGTLIKAVALLTSQLPGIKLLLVGDGPELTSLRELAAAALGSGRFFSTGRSDDVAGLLSAMDLFAQPSLSEGMSNTILEAMSGGVPPVATRVGGNSEVIEDKESGWMFSPRDVEHLSSLIAKLASNSELRTRCGRAARLRVLNQFSNETMFANYRQLYSSLVKVPNVNPSRVGWLPKTESQRP